MKKTASATDCMRLSDKKDETESKPGGSRTQYAAWMLFSMIPTAALIVFTHHLTQDVVNLPLLWVLPLSLYLISFVVCFLWPRISPPTPLRSILLLMPLVVMFLVPRMEFDFQTPFLWKIVFICAGLFSICMYFHGDLERAKPDPADLTAYYLTISLGGCLGSVLAAVAAPLVFKSNFEFYGVLIAATFFMLRPVFQISRRPLRLLFYGVFLLILILAYINVEVAGYRGVVARDRSFYGTYTILDLPAVPEKRSEARILQQGTTIHGGQARDNRQRLMPVAYFYEASGVGSALRLLEAAKDIAVVGLGTGVVALYGRQGQRFDFFEIDPAVIDIALTHFENLKASQAAIRYFVGDARLELNKRPEASYDIIILDAFNSGSIPTHLITREAIEGFMRRLRPEGLILYHISNRYVDLLPVLNCVAEQLGVYIRHLTALGDSARLQFPSEWVLLTRSPGLLARLEGADPGWRNPPQDKVCWRDDFTHVWSVVKLLH